MKHSLEKIHFTVVLLLIYTYTDIIVGKAWPYLNITKDNYFFGWEEVLVLLIVAQVVRFRHEKPLIVLMMATAFLLLARNGAEDFLFYLLSGQLPPADLSAWLTGQLIFPKPATAFSTYFGTIWGVTFLTFAASGILGKLKLKLIHHSKALEANSKLGSA